MLELDNDVLTALEESHTPGWSVQAFYGPTLTLPAVPITTDGSIKFDADGQVQGRGSLYLAQDGASLIPKSKTDALAPFGQELVVSRTVSAGKTLLASIPLGRFRITDVPDTQEFFRRFPSMDPSNPANDPRRVVGWVCQLDLQDRFESIIADDFLNVTSPLPGATCWSEIRRLSPYPIVVSLPDKPVPAGITYASRYAAIKLLMNTLGGEPAFDRGGALTGRVKDAWMTATQTVFEINGTISLNDSFSNNVYNQVQLKSSVGGNELVAFKQILDESNPLAVTRPIGGRTYRDTLPLETQAELDAAAATVLARVSTRQAKTVQVRCLPRPDLDLGDFGMVKDPQSGREVVGEVASMSFSLDPTALMTLELVAAETR